MGCEAYALMPEGRDLKHLMDTGVSDFFRDMETAVEAIPSQLDIGSCSCSI